MTTATFDTLAYARKLESVGFSREQAEVQAEAFRLFAENQSEKARQELATKADLREMELRLKYSLLKWQWAIALALAAIMAKGFGWLGF